MKCLNAAALLFIVVGIVLLFAAAIDTTMSRIAAQQEMSEALDSLEQQIRDLDAQLRMLEKQVQISTNLFDGLQEYPSNDPNVHDGASSTLLNWFAEGDG